jgi:hypothetical protein
MPSFFDKLWGQIFAKPIPPSVPIISEPLTRKEAERGDYFRWVQTPLCANMKKSVLQAYRLKQQQEGHEIQVHLLSMPYANGFALSFDQPFTPSDFMHFFDWLKDRMLLQPYRLANADRQLFDRGAYVETKEKYYFKPKNEASLPPFNQHYGNVLIECVYIDRLPSYLKLVANIYSDRNYTEAKPFDGLLHQIFGEA